MHQLAECGVHQTLALDRFLPVRQGFRSQAEMALAGRIVSAVAAMLFAVVREFDACRRSAEWRRASISVATGPVSGRSLHLYSGVRWQRSNPRFHGRVEGAQARCAVPGCGAPGEFKAPLQPANFDGPGAWRFLCLDHVRQHNMKYNWFEGMSPEEIQDAQGPLGGWERPSRKFAQMALTRARLERFHRSARGNLGPVRAHPPAAGAVALQQGGTERTVGAGPWRGRRPASVAPDAIRPWFAAIIPTRMAATAAMKPSLGEVIEAYQLLGSRQLSPSRGRALRAGNRDEIPALLDAARDSGMREQSLAVGLERGRASPISSTQSA